MRLLAWLQIIFIIVLIYRFITLPFPSTFYNGFTVMSSSYHDLILRISHASKHPERGNQIWPFHWLWSRTRLPLLTGTHARALIPVSHLLTSNWIAHPASGSRHWSIHTRTGLQPLVGDYDADDDAAAKIALELLSLALSICLVSFATHECCEVAQQIHRGTRQYICRMGGTGVSAFVHIRYSSRFRLSRSFLCF